LDEAVEEPEGGPAATKAMPAGSILDAFLTGGGRLGGALSPARGLLGGKGAGGCA